MSMVTSQIAPFRLHAYMVVSALILGVIYNYLFFHRQLGVSVLIFTVLLLVGFLLLNHLSKSKLTNGRFWPLAGTALFFAAMTAIWADPLLTIINLILVIGLLLLLIYGPDRERLKNYKLNDYASTFLIKPFILFIKGVELILGILRLKQFSTDSRIGAKIAKGVLMALPAVILFLVLFSSADLVFRRLMQNLFSFNFPQDTLPQVILILFITIVVTGYFGSLFTATASGNFSGSISLVPSKKIGITEISVFLGIINAVFLLFLIIQGAYLFGGQQNVTELGFTYAEYARRGFFELLVVSCITFVILLFGEKSIETTDRGHATIVKTLSYVLTLQVFVVMIAAAARLFMYQGMYGLTLLRFYSLFFMLWLAGMFILLGYKIARLRRDEFLWYGGLIITLVWFAGLNLVGPERYIATQNYRHLVQTEKFDEQYVASLSPDAIPALVKALDNADPETRNRIYIQLDKARLDLYRSKNQWMEWNWSRERARKALTILE